MKRDTKDKLRNFVKTVETKVKDKINNLSQKTAATYDNLKNNISDSSAVDADLQFLAKASNEDLDPLVNYLIKEKDGSIRTTEELTKQEKYRKYNPDHHQY